MQADIDFFVAVAFFSAVATFWVLHKTPTQNPVRQGMFGGYSAIAGALAAFYYLEHHGYTALSAGIGGDSAIFAALCLFGALGLALYIVDLYYNIDELRHDRAYNVFGDIGLAVTTIATAQFVLFLAVIPWFLADPTIIEIKSTVWYVDGVDAPGAVRMVDLFAFAWDQTGKAILFDIAEVYRFGLTNISNNPEHLTFSTVCLIYRTLVSVFVTVIAYRLIFARPDPK